MKQYKIFKHPSDSIEVVKQGWSWPAFFFGAIWAMTKKMWLLGTCFLLGSFVLSLIINSLIIKISGGDASNNAIINIFTLIVCIVFGMNGNLWREKNLISRGFEYLDTVTAANSEGAAALHLKNIASSI